MGKWEARVAYLVGKELRTHDGLLVRLLRRITKVGCHVGKA